ncbi:acyl-coenzyme A amino acid N-acyltransferase 1-like isoform X1 [Hyla sarda]|uniref:acyl-coenzyme A amino acid N-acyltransferase 1-like isoform X1 n=2 Tax=Hyla sarda TaxID=327740 RepID=UPI0024C2889B|nr:acyl-coenzyme A amino acid N-acyltransferase 1-like isoform X1 [Hyla sarda]
MICTYICCRITSLAMYNDFSDMVILLVSPEISLVDEPVKIQASGLPPEKVITLRAWLKDEKGQIFQSRAFYKTDMEGNVDLETSPATGGDFHGVCPMGLFWSLKPVVPFLRLMKRDVMGSPFSLHLELYTLLVLTPLPEDSPAATKVIERWYTAPGVQRTLIREGRVRGALFLPPGEGPFPGVIDMFGGVGGLIEFRSSLLASRGFASLALAYFAYDDLPSFLGEMDLKYFEEAAQFLCAHPKVSSDGIGVVAICKGAEIALAMASYLPQVAATVCINGTNAVNGNSLIYGDLALSGIPYKAERLLITDFGSLSLLNFLDDSGKPEHQDSILPLEKARGPILFLVGDKDENYNSLFFAREANARAVKYGKKDVYLRCYPGAGHLLEPPGSPFCSVSQSTFFPLPLTWGGELVAHCRAQETSWKELQEFLRKNVRCSRWNKL